MMLGIVLVLFLLAAGCVSTQPPGTNPPGTNPPAGLGWYVYKPVQAPTNPWQVADIQFIVAPTELERAQAWLSSIGINFTDAVFVPHDEITCDALNCPRGDYLLVNASDDASKAKLLEAGFTLVNEPFVYVKNVSATGTYTITLVNASNETIFYGGCNEYVPQKIVNGEAIPMPPKTCIWEGIPTTLEAGKSISFDAQVEKNGTYNVAVGYGVGCNADEPLSQAACTSEKTIFSNSFLFSSSTFSEAVAMTYGLKQCLSNPWQVDTNELILTEDKVAFTQWLGEKGITPYHVEYVPAPNDLAVCLACSCASGETYRIIVSPEQQTAAEALGFVFVDSYAWPAETPAFAEATWHVYTPYQCFANKWNVKKEPVRNIERDFTLMKEWLEEKGVKITYLGFIRGVSLSQQCTKLSTDKYGVAVTDQESMDILSTVGFVVAGPQQTKKFTLFEETDSIQYLFKTKFCQAPPWGTPDLSVGNESEVVESVLRWLTDSGIPSYAKPTIHKVGVSVTGSCGTDSGLGVLITVPEWAETHVTPYGFGKLSYAFDAEKSQVYPVKETDDSAAGGTMPAGGEACVGEECAYT